jgi:hypothetical protein
MPSTSDFDNNNNYFMKALNDYTQIVFLNGYIIGFVTGSALTFIIMSKKLK